MEITYSLSESLLMMLCEIMITGLAVLSAWCVMFFSRSKDKDASASKKKITFKAGLTYFIASQITAFFISMIDSVFSMKGGSIAWNDDIRQFYLHAGLGLVTCGFCLLVILHEKLIKKNPNVFSDFGGSLVVTFTGTIVLSVLYLVSASPLHYEEHKLQDVYVVAWDGYEHQVVYADGHYWIFNQELPSLNQSLLKEVIRGRHHLICTSERNVTCWSGKKIPKNSTPVKKQLIDKKTCDMMVWQKNPGELNTCEKATN